MSRAVKYERASRTAPAECFSGGFGRGPIEPIETPRWYADMPWYAWAGAGAFAGLTLGLALVIGGAW